MNGPKVSISFVGDVMPGGLFAERLCYYLDRFLPDELAKRLRADVVFANLECPASNAGAPMHGKILVHCLPEALQALVKMGVNVVNVATNHMMDYGFEGAKATLDALDALGIRHTGCGADLGAAREPAVLDLGGFLVSVHGYSWTSEFVQAAPAATELRPGLAPIKLEHICRDVREARKSGSNLVVVSLHWGEAKSYYPRPSQVRQARAIIEAGADLVIGHHPHCIQGMEVHAGKPIFYSVGNFLSAPYMRDEHMRLVYGGGCALRRRELRTRKSFIGKVVFESSRLVSADIFPVLQDEHEPLMLAPDPRIDAEIRKRFQRLSRRIQQRWYPLLFPVLRRVGELGRLADDYREHGLKAEHLSPRTLWRVAKKLVTGRSFH